MAITNRCQFPHDLAFAVKQMEVEIGGRIIDNQKLLKDAESTLSGLDDALDEGNKLLDDLLAKNGAGTTTSSGLKDGASVAAQYGLLPDKPTIADEEKFIANANLILVDGVVYLQGTLSDNFKDTNNVETLRRLYFALGKNLNLVDEVLNSATKTVFVQDQLVIKKVPPRGPKNYYDLEEVKTLLDQKQLTRDDLAYVDDYSQIVLLKSYLALDKSKAETIKNGVSVSQLITNVFHLDGIDTSTSAMTRYASLGYTGDELNSILTGEDFVQANKITVVNKIDSLHLSATKLISLIDFMINRMENNRIAYLELTNFYNQINLGLQKLMQEHEGLITNLNFEVSKYLKKDILQKLRKKHTDEKIVYLLEQRPEVKGLWFDPPPEILIMYLKRSITAAAPNTTFVSNQFLNQTTKDKYSKATAIAMFASLFDTQNALGGAQNVNSLKAAKKYLYVYIGSDPLVLSTIPSTVTPTTGKITWTPVTAKKTTTQEILQGQPSAASPAPILVNRFDVFKTFDYEDLLQQVLGSFDDLNDMYPPNVAGPIADVIDSITNLFTKVLKAIDTLIAQAEKTLFAMKKRLDAFLSKYLSLTGQGNFNSSLLKCSINWDIGVSTDVLDMIFNFLMKFIGQVLAFLSKLKAWISDILTKILCMPVNLLNSFIGKLETALPSACRLPRMDLGKKLNTSLGKLANVSTAKSIVLSACGNDIAKLKMSISAAPDRLGQFKESALCESSASSNFMNAANLNITAGVSL